MKRFIRATYFAIILSIIYIPVIVMIIFSFNSGSSVSSWMGFSTKWYEDFIKNSPFIKSIITSLFVAVISTIISVIIGTMAAIGLSRVNKPTRSKWVSIANVPLINADIITAVALMTVFLISGIKFGLFTLVMAHVSFNVPYVLITVMPRLRKIDKSIVEASYDLGAKNRTVIFKVILPILKPAIIIATVIAFAMSFDDFIISYFTGGGVSNVGSFIYSAKKIRPYIFAFGTIVVLIIATGVIIWNAFAFAKESKENTKGQIKNGTYKSKQLYKLEEEIAKLNNQLDSLTKIKRTLNIAIWFKYFVLKFKLKKAKSKNYDKQIAKLDWKRYKLQNEINREKRYGSRLKKAESKFSQLKKQLSKTEDIKKAAKLSIQIEKVEEKIIFLKEEIDWINSRDKEAAKKAKSIDKKIKQYKKEFKAEINPSKKTINWYNKKIKYYEEWKIEVEEGKNNYKLRMIVERLKEVKEINENKISQLSDKMNLVYAQVFRSISITSNINKKISNNSNNQNLVNQRNLIVISFEEKINKLISLKNDRILKIKSQTAKAKEKYFPSNIDEANFTKGFVSRTWKMFLVGILALSSLTGLTVAYVMNNIYDLVIGNWGEYIDLSLIKEFEKEYDVKVNYQVYDSNETLYNKLYTFTYDLMVPSDYMVQKLVDEDKLEALDYSKINAWSQEFGDNIQINPDKNPSKLLRNSVEEANEPEALEIYNDLLNVMYNSKIEVDDVPEHSLNSGTIVDYAIPYLWGDLVIIVNPNNKGSNKDSSNIKWLLEKHPEVLRVKNSDGTTTDLSPNAQFDPSASYEINNSQLSWSILWDAAADGKEVVLNEDPKNVFAIAGQKLYGEGNLTEQYQIDGAAKELKTLLSYKNVGLQGDSLISTASEGNFDFAVMYNGDGAYANLIYNGEDGDDGGDEEDSLTRIEDEEKVYFLYGRPNKEHKEENKTFTETTNIYSDNLVMSKKSKNKDLAYDFINFFIAHASDISDFTGTPTGFVETLEEAVNPVDGTYKTYKKLFEPILLDKDDAGKINYEGNLQPFYNNRLDPKLVDAYNILRAGKN